MVFHHYVVEYPKPAVLIQPMHLYIAPNMIILSIAKGENWLKTIKNNPIKARIVVITKIILHKGNNLGGI